MAEYTDFEDDAFLDQTGGSGYDEEGFDFEDFEGRSDGSPDLEDFELGATDFEADEWDWLKKAWKGIRRAAKKAAPIAKRLAPVAGTIVGGALGGPPGAMLGSKVGRLAGSIDGDGYDAYGDYEDDMDTADEMDAEDLPSYEGESDGMADYMADIAARAPSPTDAAAMAGAGTITIAAKAPVEVKKVAPTIASAAARLTQVMKKSPRSAILVKTVPTIAAKTAATLAKKAENGKPVTPRTAKRVMAKHAIRTLTNTRELTKALARNEVRKRRLNTRAIMRAERYA